MQFESHEYFFHYLENVGNDMNELHPVTTGYALWLLPQVTDRQRLYEIIAKLSQRYGTPTFEPHLTLLSGIKMPENELTNAVSGFAKSLKPIQLLGKEFGTTEKFFQCFFLKVELNDMLLELRKEAHPLFGSDTNKSFLPHISLMYGYISKQDKDTLKREFSTLLPLQLTIDTMALWYIDEKMENWRKVQLWCSQSCYR